MPALIYGILAWAMGGFIQTILVGAGLTLITYIGLSPLVEAGLNSAVSQLTISGLNPAILQLALMTGLGEGLSIIGSSILTRISIDVATAAVGLKKSS